MKKIFLGGMILLLCIVVVAPASAATEKLSPDADTSNYESIPDANGDTIHDYLYVFSRTGSMNRRSLIHFDVSSVPPGATVESAKLYMNIWTVKSDRTNDIHRVLGSWSEPIVTWNTQPSYESTPTDSPNTGTTPGIWMEWDVTADVQAFVDGTPNYGWLLKDPIEYSDPSAYAKYYSREYADPAVRPYLEVTYTEAEPAPVAAFSGLPLSGPAPLTVQFTDESTGTITSYEWDFENDGTIDSADQSPSHIYDTPGTYTVKLVVGNAGGSDDEVKTDFITVEKGSTQVPEFPAIAFPVMVIGIVGLLAVVFRRIG